MNLYSNQDTIIDTKGIDYNTMQSMPYWRFQVLVDNLNKNAKESSEQTDSLTNQYNIANSNKQMNSSIKNISNKYLK